MIPGTSPNLTRSITSATLPNTRSSNTTTRKEERGRTQRPPVQCTTTSRTDTRKPTNPGGRPYDYPHSHVEHRHVHLEDVLHRHRHEPYGHDSNEYHVRSLAPVPGAPSAAVGKTRQAVAW